MTNSTWYDFIVLNSGFEIYFLFFLGNFNRHDLAVDFNFFNHLDLRIEKLSVAKSKL